MTNIALHLHPAGFIQKHFFLVNNAGAFYTNIVKLRKCLTIVELSIVLTVIAVLSAVVAGTFFFIVRQEIDANARKLASDLMWGREMAGSLPTNIAGEDFYTVSFDLSNKSYVLYRGAAQPGNTARILKKDSFCVDQISVERVNGTGTAEALTPAEIRLYYPSGTMVDPVSNSPFITPNNKLCINLRSGQAQAQLKIYGNTGFIQTGFGNPPDCAQEVAPVLSSWVVPSSPQYSWVAVSPQSCSVKIAICTGLCGSSTTQTICDASTLDQEVLICPGFVSYIPLITDPSFQRQGYSAAFSGDGKIIEYTGMNSCSGFTEVVGFDCSYENYCAAWGCVSYRCTMSGNGH